MGGLLTYLRPTSLSNRNSGRRADAIARDHVAEAMDVIRDVMIDPLSETKDRLKAAEIILERGEGKVAQAIIAIPGSKADAARLATMTDQDLLSIIESEPLPSLMAPSVDADFEDIVPAGTIDPLLL